MEFICRNLLLFSTLAVCPTSHAGAGIYRPRLQHVPTADWPEREERSDPQHLLHEERTLRVTVDSGASGALTNSSPGSTHVSTTTHVAWLRNALSENLIVVSGEDANSEWLEVESKQTVMSDDRFRTKPYNSTAKWQRERARRNC